MENRYKPAFAHACTTANGETHSIEEGLTKREYFAGLAIQGLLANSTLMEEDNGWPWMANSAVNLADELLKRLEQ